MTAKKTNSIFYFLYSPNIKAISAMFTWYCKETVLASSLQPLNCSAGLTIHQMTKVKINTSGQTNTRIHANGMLCGWMVMLIRAVTLECSWFTSSQYWLSFSSSSHSPIILSVLRISLVWRKWSDGWARERREDCNNIHLRVIQKS